MVDLIELTNAMATTFQNIPKLMGLVDSVDPYIDLYPEKNKMSDAIYTMPAGSILVIWMGTTMVIGTMTLWAHMINVFVRAKRGGSALEIINALVDGIPVPGDGLRWRYCPVLDGCLPTEVRDIVRLQDEEGIDYYVLVTITPETGDSESATS